MITSALSGECSYYTRGFMHFTTIEAPPNFQYPSSSLLLSSVQSMASRLLSRSKTLALTLIPHSPLHPSQITDSFQSLRCLHSLVSVARPSGSSSTVPSSPAISSVIGSGSPKTFGYDRTLPRWFSVKAQGGPVSHVCNSAEKKEIVKVPEGVVEPDSHLKEKEVICFSPLEATKTRSGALSSESLKIKRVELSQKITYSLIPALLLISKSSLTTSLLIFSVYWQIYGFFKEIFLDYVHQDVTRTWVLVYFKVLLLILAKDTIINFGLV